MPELNRRSFLGWAAVGSAGLLVPELIRAKPRPVVFDLGRVTAEGPVFKTIQLRIRYLSGLVWVSQSLLVDNAIALNLALKSLEGRKGAYYWRIETPRNASAQLRLSG